MAAGPQIDRSAAWARVLLAGSVVLAGASAVLLAWF